MQKLNDTQREPRIVAECWTCARAVPWETSVVMGVLRATPILDLAEVADGSWAGHLGHDVREVNRD